MSKYVDAVGSYKIKRVKTRSKTGKLQKRKACLSGGIFWMEEMFNGSVANLR